MKRAFSYFVIVSFALCGAATTARAGGMTCADYDKPDVYKSCERGVDCCAGAASWKAACDVFHVHAGSHAEASELVARSNKARRAWYKDFKACTVFEP